MSVQLLTTVPIPSFLVDAHVHDDIGKLIAWLMALDHQQMTLRWGDVIYTFHTPQERIYFAFGLEKAIELARLGILDADVA